MELAGYYPAHVFVYAWKDICDYWSTSPLASPGMMVVNSVGINTHENIRDDMWFSGKMGAKVRVKSHPAMALTS